MEQVFYEMIQNSDNIVFFGGAGVSTESGVPDFRGQDGLYRQRYKYPPETILSHTFFINNTEEFYDFYREKMLISEEIRPNDAHLVLARLEKQGKLKAVITQNIDGLHQAAGSKNVLELHGSIHRNYCTVCGKFHETETINQADGVPRCMCGGIIKPDVVLYEEGLNTDVINKAIYYISNADMLIIGGTSLNVYPAAGLIRYYTGDKLILVNKTPTPADQSANLVIHGSIGKIFHPLLRK